ncbi:hypothetical protein [Aliiroseovarius sp. 2305UL8-7]|uniref:hypothetical protein n=1 Tax=Aliiroseovarius conchicola TaxID=3121637 RepID=UPI003527494D
MKTSSLAIAATLGAHIAPAFANTAAEVDVWQVLSAIEFEETVTETSYSVNKIWPSDLAETPEEIEITGYAIPVLGGEQVVELLLTSDMGLCPLCGSGDHGASLQVTLDEPIIGFEEGQRISLRGTLSRVEDSETWQAARMTGARVIDR